MHPIEGGQDSRMRYLSLAPKPLFDLDNSLIGLLPENADNVSLKLAEHLLDAARRRPESAQRYSG